MQYELKTQVIEPLRPTFTKLIERYGNKPASRYQEGTIGLQPVENFHFRPTWAPDKELYDKSFSKYLLTDPDAFTDPRQYYYTPYVTNRSSMHESFGKTLDYVTGHGLLGRTPDDWRKLIAEIILPLRHYESGGQMLFSNACRFTYGATLAQCFSYESFDRVGNAQLISRVGIAFGDQTAKYLAGAKELWVAHDSFQPLRKMLEELLVEEDYADSVVGLDLIDRFIDQLVYRYLDEEAINHGAGAYSLLAQHIGTWYADHRKWLDPLYKAWINDENHGADNAAHMSAAVNAWLPQAYQAVRALAERADEIVNLEATAAVDAHLPEVIGMYRDLGLDINDVEGA